MAILLTKEGSYYNAPIKTYVCDTYNEALAIENKTLGTRIYAIDTKKFYICNSNGELTEISENIAKLL